MYKVNAMLREIRYTLLCFLASVFILLNIAGCGEGADIGDNRRQTLGATDSQLTSQAIDDLYRFFIIAFAAAPGVTYMNQLMEAGNAGLSTKEIVNIFTTKQQFLETYPLSLSNADFAAKIVNNVVGASAAESAKSEAILDIVSALEIAGWTRGDVVYAVFSNLAKKTSDDVKWWGTALKLSKQVVVAKFFTEVKKIDTLDITILRAAIGGVDQNTNISDDLDGILLSAGIGQWREYFQEIPVSPTDISLQQYEIDTDPSGVVFNTEVAVDVDKSGLKTIIVHGYSYPEGCNFQILDTCVLWASDKYVFKDRIIALQVQSDLTVKNITKSVFGAEQVALGGASRKVVAKDINGDGVLDLIYAMNQDHENKPGEAGDNNFSQTVVLLSNSVGGYRIYRIGARGFFHSADFIFDDSFTPFAVGASYSNVGVVQKLSNGIWVDVSSGYFDLPLSANSFISVPRSKASRVTQYIFDDANDSLITTRLRRLIDGVWTIIDKWTAEDLGEVSIVGSDGRSSVSRLTKIDGRYFLGAGFNFGCVFYVNSKSNPAVLTTTTPESPSSQIQKNSYERSELSYIYKYLGFEFNNGRLNYVPIRLPGDTGKNDYNFYQCEDINDDGNSDLVQMKFDGKPTVYLGNGDWTFRSVPSERLPPFPVAGSMYPGWTAIHVLYEDLNGDGIRDVIYLTGFVKKSEGRNYGAKIYLGKKLLAP